jgi:predicted Fe-Mo cluster-binding NifX family protein
MISRSNTMKICLTSQGDSLESQLDPRFGRSAFFIFVDSETEEFEVIENTQVQATGGAGIQAGMTIVEKGVKVLLTGNVGPNAYHTLQAGGVEIITGASGSVKEVLRKYQQGAFKSTGSPNVEPHFGLKSGDAMKNQ